MKIAAVCCTYLRPQQLGHMIRCFELQDYPIDKRELVILDDAGQYDNQRGEGWRLVSTSRRFRTLGEKRNAAAALISDDVDAVAVWDDDDLYLSWALRASVAALDVAPWSRPSLVLHPQQDGSLAQHETGGLFHGGWAYTCRAFHQAGGYPRANNGEDQSLAKRMMRARLEEADPIQLGFKPFYVFMWNGGGSWHLSGMGGDGYRRLGALGREKAALVISDTRTVNVLAPIILPGIRPRVF